MAIWIAKKNKDSFNNTLFDMKKRIGKLSDIDKLASNPSFIAIEGAYMDYISLTYKRKGFNHKKVFNAKLKAEADYTAASEAADKENPLPQIKSSPFTGMKKEKAMYGYTTYSKVIGHSRVFFQLKENTGLRFQWNPWKLGIEGHKTLGEILGSLFYDGSDDLFIDFLERAEITRLDITYDFGNCDIERLAVYWPNKKSRRSWVKGGRIETLYLGDTDLPHVKVYDKLAELNTTPDKAEEEEMTARQIMKQFYEERYKAVTRVENVTHPDCLLWQAVDKEFDLHNLRLYDRSKFLSHIKETPLNRYIWQTILFRKPQEAERYFTSPKEKKHVKSAIEKAKITATTSTKTKPKGGVKVNKKGGEARWYPYDLFAGDFKHHLLEPLMWIISDKVKISDLKTPTNKPYKMQHWDEYHKTKEK